jgi:hypothetical protein
MELTLRSAAGLITSRVPCDDRRVCLAEVASDLLYLGYLIARDLGLVPA